MKVELFPFKRRLSMNLGQGLLQRLECIKTRIFPK